MKIGFINNTNVNFPLEHINYEIIHDSLVLKQLNKINKYEDYDYIFIYENEILYLKDCNLDLPAISSNFSDGTSSFRIKNIGINQDLFRAVGINKDTKTIVDTTAGLGKDSFLFSLYGTNIIMLEQNSLIYNITKDAINRAVNNKELSNFVKKIQFFNCNSIDFLKNNDVKPDCVYLDPMFPKTNKNALSKKEMQIFHNLAFYGNNEELFNVSMEKTKNRVVIKRKINSEYLVNKEPDFKIKGRVIRFDIYLKK